MPLYLFLLAVALTGAAAQPRGNNQLNGAILVPAASNRPGPIRRGDAYRQRNQEAPSEEEQRLAQENHPDRHVVIAAYPLDFTPEVQPTPNAVIYQQGKTFIPNVLPVTQGSVVYFVNRDDFYHNVFSISPGARFNIGRRPPGDRKGQTISRSGEVEMFCDIHPQMKAVILSLTTPYFTKIDENGRYRLPDLPDGRYRIEVFHAAAGYLKSEVDLRAGATRRLDFNYNDGSAVPAGTGSLHLPTGADCCGQEKN